MGAQTHIHKTHKINFKNMCSLWKEETLLSIKISDLSLECNVSKPLDKSLNVQSHDRKHLDDRS